MIPPPPGREPTTTPSIAGPPGRCGETLDNAALEAALRRCLDAVPAATAGYVSIRRLGRPAVGIDLAAGATVEGRPARPSDLWPSYCVTKPLLPLLLAVAAPHLLDATVELEPPGPGEEPVVLTTAHILTHEAGLVWPTSLDRRMQGAQLSNDVVVAGARLGPGPEYSDLAGWALLEVLFRHEAARDAGEALVEDVLGPLGLAGDLLVTPSQVYGADCRRLVCHRMPSGSLFVPMLSEILVSELELARPAFGGLATSRALADLFAAVGHVLAGDTVEGLPSTWVMEKLLGIRGRSVDSPRLGRAFAFAGGFMANHASPAFPRLSCAAIGHIGGPGPTGVVLDPDLGLVLSYHLNGAFDGFEPLQRAKAVIFEELLDALAI